MKTWLLGLSFFIAGATYAQNDPFLNLQWWTKSAVATGGATLEEAWKITKNKYTPNVAVIDTGVDVNHPDLQGQILVNQREIPNNGIDDDRNGCVDDYFGCDALTMQGDVSVSMFHGTHVAGTIAAKHNNGIGIAGAARFVKLIPVKVDFSKTPSLEIADQAVARAIDYAVMRGADIINLSFGTNDPIPFTKMALSRAHKRRVLVVIAAGNDGSELVARNVYPALYARNFSNILVVASSTEELIKAASSNYSPLFVHVFAPGQRIYATMPGGAYDYKNGTSMATPVVAGVAANIYATYGKLPAEAVKERIIETSHRFESFDGFVSSNGLVNAYNAITGQMSINFTWKR